MEPDGTRLWTLARVPDGPLAAYLDAFATQLDKQGFRRGGLGQQMRAAARFSHWLQTEDIAAEFVTDEDVRRFLDEPAQRGFVVQGAAATLRRLM